MSHRILSTVFVIAVAAVVCTSLAAPAEELEAGFVSMFNGKDLTGWEGKPGGWSVEDGAITGQSTKENPCKECHYLMWRGGEPGDFDLKLSYKLVGGNSGIQIRTKEKPNWDTSGYQADMEAGQTWTGALFEHTRGGIAMRGTRVVIDPDGKKHITKVAESADLQKHVKANDWNEYHITAVGPEITLKINGQVMAQVTDNQKNLAAAKGIIALQMHPGPPMKVQFKNIRIKLMD